MTAAGSAEKRQWSRFCSQQKVALRIDERTPAFADDLDVGSGNGRPVTTSRTVPRTTTSAWAAAPIIIRTQK